MRRSVYLFHTIPPHNQQGIQLNISHRCVSTGLRHDNTHMFDYSLHHMILCHKLFSIKYNFKLTTCVLPFLLFLFNNILLFVFMYMFDCLKISIKYKIHYISFIFRYIFLVLFLYV